MKTWIILLGLCLFFSAAKAQSGDTDLWPEKVDALVLSNVHQVKISKFKKIEYKYSRKVLILNNAGNEYAKMFISQSDFIKTGTIKAHVTTLDGSLIRKLDKKDIESFTYSPGFILYDDAKYDYIDFSCSNYPYIFQVEYEQDIKSLFFWPDWMPQENIPVLRSTYRLDIDEHIAYKTHAINIDAEPTVKQNGKRKTLNWTMQDIEPVEDESYMPPEHKLQKALFFAPMEFALGRYKGSFESWDSYAQWYQELTSDVYDLDAVTTAKVQYVIGETKDKREIVDKLFSFLQGYTRYVAIEPGLSGWQPHTSQSVFENRYGDCKDLTSLMISMLKIAGIQAYPTLVKSQSRGLLFCDFPSSQFNHVIAVVPIENDTIWLECTADLMPSNFVPDSYEGSDVLVVTQDGGEIWRTPKSKAQDNFRAGVVEGKLKTYGDLEFTSLFKAGGNQGDYYRSSLYFKDHEDEKQWIEEFAGRYQPNINLNDYLLCNIENNLTHPVEMQVSGVYRKFAKMSSSRLFFNPNVMMRKSGDSIPNEDERLFPIYYKYAYTDSDTLRLELPDGYELEAAPESLNVMTEFASFQTSYHIEANYLQYIRTISIIKSLIPVEDYHAFRDFIKKVVKSDRSQFVFKKVS